MEHQHSPWLGRLTAVVIRGHTDLRVRINEETMCVCVEMDGTPCPVLLGVTPSGAENLRTAIDKGLADLAARRQANSDDSTTADSDD